MIDTAYSVIFVMARTKYNSILKVLYTAAYIHAVIYTEASLFDVCVFTDVGAVLQAALCLHLHRPLADHMGLSLSRLCSALCCASYPSTAVSYHDVNCTLSHQFLSWTCTTVKLVVFQRGVYSQSLSFLRS